MMKAMRIPTGAAILPAILLAALFAQPAAAQDGARPVPVTVPLPPALPDAQDTPWPGGTITLDVDASDVARGVYRVTQSFPLAPGTSRLTLLLPEWLPGAHGPRGPLAELAGLQFSADGRAAAWQRDGVEPYAFHVDLPAGARTLTARFVHTSPLLASEGRITMTREMLNLQWEKMSLYPAGHYVRRVRVRPSVTLPRGWTAAAALDGESVSGERVSWAETDYENLVDSPIFAGMHFRRWDLGNQVALSAVADEPGQLALAAENQARLANLASEARLAFGGAPYDRYLFLVALTDRLGGIGLEHHRSSENQLETKTFTDWAAFDWDRNVLPHELAHAWIGKFRRPAGMWTPDYRRPLQNDLLWVYEGHTQLWGLVLAARSGVQTAETVLGMLAVQAGLLSEHPGRGWRSLTDTTLDPVFAARKPKPYASLTRGEDYYWEGALVWLEADAVIRRGTGGRRSIDDFTRAFFAPRPGDPRQATFTRDDVLAALNRVHPYDWAGFFRSRIDSSNQPPPLAGLEASGYRLVWRDAPNPFDKARMDNARNLNLYHSLGLTADKDGDISAVRWDGPAFNAGIATGAKLIAVNGLAYDQDRLKAAITAARSGEQGIALLLRRDDRYETVTVPWRGGLRWPWLERKDANAALDRLLAPRRGGR